MGDMKCVPIPNEVIICFATFHFWALKDISFSQKSRVQFLGYESI